MAVLTVEGLKDFMKAPNNNNVCIVQVWIYIYLLTIPCWHYKAAEVTKMLVDLFVYMYLLTTGASIIMLITICVT